MQRHAADYDDDDDDDDDVGPHLASIDSSCEEPGPKLRQ
jgi:hypothetical protein